MSLSKRQNRNQIAQWTLSLTFCLFQSGLLAREPVETTLFTLADEEGGRLEVVIHEESGAVFARFYENGDLLVWEQPLQGNLKVGGAVVFPSRTTSAGGREKQKSGWQMADPYFDLITDNPGSGTPPSGPPPNGGN